MSKTRRAIGSALAVIAIAVVWYSKINAQETSSAGVITVFDHAKLDASFAKAIANGGSDVLWNHASGGEAYNVSTHSRETVKGACKPEGCSHKGFTAVVYVVSGAATLVVGGTTKAAAPEDKSSGLAIQGGESHRISKGDMYVVPPDTIHWYKDVQAPFQYLEVPVR